VSFLLPCPNCGPRSVYEFRFGGESDVVADADSVYDRFNEEGVQSELWFHRSGCRKWFQAVRDTRTNEVKSSGWVETTVAESPAP
jgi:heterotetrameric sarcosine oxidase delta subunit